jgi:hypothetical protein
MSIGSFSALESAVELSAFAKMKLHNRDCVRLLIAASSTSQQSQSVCPAGALIAALCPLLTQTMAQATYIFVYGYINTFRIALWLLAAFHTLMHQVSQYPSV